MRQLERGEAAIAFDTQVQTTHFVVVR